MIKSQNYVKKCKIGPSGVCAPADEVAIVLGIFNFWFYLWLFNSWPPFGAESCTAVGCLKRYLLWPSQLQFFLLLKFKTFNIFWDFIINKYLNLDYYLYASLNYFISVYVCCAACWGCCCSRSPTYLVSCDEACVMSSQLSCTRP